MDIKFCLYWGRNSRRLPAKTDSIHKRAGWFEIERREKSRLDITLTTITQT